MVLEVGYVGTKGTKLVQPVDLNGRGTDTRHPVAESPASVCAEVHVLRCGSYDRPRSGRSLFCES